MSTKDITSFCDKFLEILTSNKYDCNFWILQMEFCETAIKFNTISKTTLCQKRPKIPGRCHLLWLLLSTWALVSYENHWTCPFLVYWKEDGKECLTLEIMLLALQSCFIDFNVIQGRFKRSEIYPFYRNAIHQQNIIYYFPLLQSKNRQLIIPCKYHWLVFCQLQMFWQICWIPISCPSKK